MASRRFNRNPYVIGEREIIITGSFVPLTGAGTVTASTVTGLGFGYAPNSSGTMALQTAARPGISGTPGITRTGTGAYSITLDDSYLECVSLVGSVGGPGTGVDLKFYPVDPVATLAVGAATVLKFVLLAVATPTDASASMRVHFTATMRDSTIQYGKP